MINEGAKILEEGMSSRPSDIDVVWVNGYGWPMYRGGPMYYADAIGLPNLVETLKEFQRQDGDDFWKPAPLIEKLVAEGKGFRDLKLTRVCRKTPTIRPSPAPGFAPIATALGGHRRIRWWGTQDTIPTHAAIRIQVRGVHSDLLTNGTICIMDTIATSMIVGYLAAVTLLGTFLASRSKTSSQWAVAGGGMGTLMVAMGVARTRIGVSEPTE